MINQVTLETLPEVWEKMLPMIKKAISKGQGDSASLEQVYDSLLRGVSQMWAIHEDGDVQACAIIAIDESPVCKKIIVQILAGSGMRDWSKDITELLLDFKQILGAKCLEASCRPGLAKYLKGEGWRQKAIIMEIS